MSTTVPTDSSFWDDISQLLGKSAAGAGSGRAAQATYQNARDSLAARLYDIEQTSRGQAANSQLASDKYRESLPGIGASEAVRGALIQNAHNATFDPGSAGARIPKMHFSVMGPDDLTPEARAAGAKLAAHGTSLLDNPAGAITAVPGSGVNGAGFLTPPTPSPELTPSFWEQAAGAGSIASGLAGALAKLAGGGGGNALKSLFGGGGGGSPMNPGSVDNSGYLPSYDPTNQQGLDPEILQAALALQNIGQDPQSGIDTSGTAADWQPQDWQAGGE